MLPAMRGAEPSKVSMSESVPEERDAASDLPVAPDIAVPPPLSLDLAPSRASLWMARTTLRLMRYPGRQWVGSRRRRQSRERGGRRFRVRTDSGVELDAWFSPAHDPAARGRQLPLVFCHGWMETKERHFKRAWRYNRQGRDLILFDHRGHGRSTGTCATFGVQEKWDLKAVIDEAQRQGFVQERVITMGFSLGGSTVLAHAAVDPRVAGVVALAPFSDFRQAIRSFRLGIAPWLDDAWLLRGFEQATVEAGFTLEEASPLEAIARITAPILLIEASGDRNLPPCHHTRRLLEARPAGGVTLWTADGANHLTLCRRSWPGLDDAIARFLEGLEGAGVIASS